MEVPGAEEIEVVSDFACLFGEKAEASELGRVVCGVEAAE